MEVKDIYELCDKKDKIQGSLKEGCILGSYVILWPKKDGGESDLFNEFNMIKEIEKIGLPVVNIKEIIPVKIGKRVSVAIVEELLKGKLFKPHNKFEDFNSDIRDQIKKVHDILKENKILIEDLQWIYNDKELKIIDPFKIYKLDDEKKMYSIIGAEQDKRKQPFRKLQASFNKQINDLYKLYKNEK
jgi:hypothetical protein